MEPEVVKRKPGLNGAVLIYGQPKIGKSMLALSLCDVVIDCEGGLDHYNGALRYRPHNAEELREAIKSAYKKGYKRIAIDTVDEVNSWFEAEVCKEQGIAQMGEGSYGADWGASRAKMQQFRKALDDRFDLVLYIGHQKLATTDETFKSRSVDLPGKLSRMFAAKMDALGFCQITDDEHVVNFQPYDMVDSGSRLPELKGLIVPFYDDILKNRKQFESLFADNKEETSDETEQFHPEEPETVGDADKSEGVGDGEQAAPAS
jgi:hypothetical protein